MAEDVALNDIVIGREGPLRVTRFHNFVKRGVPEFLYSRRDHYFHGNGFHGLQPFRRRTYCITGDEYSDHDTGGTPYPEHEKCDLSGG